jgi:tRNA1Val (adenine37-N6)-methyltransferase
MANSYFNFKQFTIWQDQCAMKVTTDGCLFGAWAARMISQQNDKPQHCLDIGTGTGLLSLMVAQQNPGLTIEAVEIDPAAAAQANNNKKSSPWQNQITVTTGDIRELAFAQQFDVIISNPPFYENELKGKDEKRNKAHHDGSLLLAELMTAVRRHLKPNGSLYLLAPYKREAEIRTVLDECLFKIKSEVAVRQTPKHGYFRTLLKTFLNNDFKEDRDSIEIFIKDKEGNYSAPFTSLLKDYYLQF